LSASEDLTIHGQMEGRISVPEHTLTIGIRADVQADVAAKSVIVLGKVTGNVTVGERLEIGVNGSIRGDVTAPRLAIADGGTLRGRVEMA
jgi:cytoskeletal protein CcmA (bactofilin family)